MHNNPGSLVRSSLGGSRPCSTSTTCTSTAACDDVSRPPLYYVLPRYTRLSQKKQEGDSVVSQGGRRWRDWRPVLDHIINYRLHVQKVRRSQSRHLPSQKSVKATLKKHKFRRTNRVPSSNRRESIRVAARIRPKNDIVQANDGEAVQPGIGKSEGFLTPVEQVVV